ncbi:TetR/AcrR family transcriptional regulator [Actinomadura alba]|uniref:TetR/AcrR family transcriptional regulator n=1 Tax=Actinomadura alba TaxID=406431 RepID=A0ABR7LSW0_9ACTN|nr:TetR/AcrR family transcriptional regulator [Actinomadura alba]MBC6467932.1 TetR/AcrR family transcriptional regulator [Actinomadura alba]
MSDETDLPPRVVLLWGLNDAPRRGPKASLTVGDITRAAVEVADAEGLGAVSMARVAAQLGNATMALYRHVKSKDELLQLMSDAAMESPPDLPEGGDWREGLTLWVTEVLTVLRRHPWCAQIPISGPPVGPHNLAWFDRALDALSGTGLSEEEKVGVVMGLLTYVQGEMRLSLELAAAYAENPEAFGRQYGRALTSVVDPRRLPALSRVVEAGVFDAESLYAEEEYDDFALGLTLYLDGLAAFIARRSGLPDS